MPRPPPALYPVASRSANCRMCENMVQWWCVKGEDILGEARTMKTNWIRDWLWALGFLIHRMAQERVWQGACGDAR